MSFTSAPTPMPVGVSNVDSGASASHSTLQGMLANDELTFAQRVRSPWWKSVWPLLASLLFGAGLLFTAGNAPPTVTVQRMLHEQEQRSLAAALEPSADYELPSQWQWPNIPGNAIPGNAGGDSRLVCDPARSVNAC